MVVVSADRPFDVADVLPAVQAWLAETGRDTATAVVDGRVYTVVSPG